MTERVLLPGVARGGVRAPPSKSYTHRALLAAFLHGGPFRIVHPLDSADTEATRRGLGALGGQFRTNRDHWTMLHVSKLPAHSHRSVRIQCDESGTTLRFLATLAAREARPVRFDGTGRLPLRPMEGLLRTLVSLGARISAPPKGRSLPLRIEGPIQGGHVWIDASVSSQFVSSLLFTLPTLAESSVLDLRGPVVSEPYIQASLEVLRPLGVRISRRGRRFTIPGDQHYSGSTFVVPGDASSAAYLWVAAAITHGSVAVRGISPRLPQADLAILRILRLAGAKVTASPSSIRVEASQLHPFTASLSDAPDLYPLVGVLGSVIPGKSRLLGGHQAAFKESDRRRGTIRLSRALGASVRSTPTALEIRGRFPPRPLRLSNLTDHRMVMSAAVAAAAASGPSYIGDTRHVRKSFPEFWNVLDGLGIHSTEKRP